MAGRPKGLPKTGGRGKGSKNKRTLRSAVAIQAAHTLVAKVLPNCFDGDAHTLLIATYRDLSVPLETRIDCAKAAIGYETPRLSATDHTSNGETLTMMQEILGSVDGATRGLPSDEDESRQSH